MNTPTNEVIAEYINDFVTDNLDGAGLVITDDQDLESEIDIISNDTDWVYLRNEIFKQDKVENLVKSLSAIEDFLTSAIIPRVWKDEINAVLDAMKELEN